VADGQEGGEVVIAG